MFCTGRRTESSVSRLKPRRIDRAIRPRLRIRDREVRRAPEGDVPLPVIDDDGVEPDM
jgi:hypothetical protein